MFRRNRSTATARSTTVERPPDRRPPARHRTTDRPASRQPGSNQVATHRADNRPATRPADRSRPPTRQNTGHHHRPAAAARSRPPAWQNTGHHYRSSAYRPLCASQVRQQRFGRSRHGLDPGEVDGFLHRIADELAALHAELRRTHEENGRIKGALRDWQSRFGPRVVRW
ncbi:DivIVA domain-containing protein [Micromonospora sp. NPDC051925]|uniref:DivIVA domain-containing protein n=1 Tax=Micromonospora sp. NPDC051925 TaxID=3364288 RepID=UPI0037CC9CD0